MTRSLLLLLPFALLGCNSTVTSNNGASSSSSSGSAGGASGGESGTSSGASGTSSGTSGVASGGDGGTAATNGFPAKWNDGTSCASEPPIQSWDFGAGTFILRQSLCTSFEGPFIYLLVGQTKALLLDTGAGGIDLRAKVLELLGNKDVELIVAHTHGHGDHTAGDSAFRNQPKTTVVGTTAAAARAFFDVTGTAPSTYDLGGRAVDVLAIPGHQAAHLAFYDRATKALFTGDTLYPGRLYIDDWTSYKTSIPRLVQFVDDGRPVSFVLGAHIEMRAPLSGNPPDFTFGSRQHPNEHVLELGDAELRELQGVVNAQGATPTRTIKTHFILDP